MARTRPVDQSVRYSPPFSLSRRVDDVRRAIIVSRPRSTLQLASGTCAVNQRSARGRSDDAAILPRPCDGGDGGAIAADAAAADAARHRSRAVAARSAFVRAAAGRVPTGSACPDGGLADGLTRRDRRRSSQRRFYAPSTSEHCDRSVVYTVRLTRRRSIHALCRARRVVMNDRYSCTSIIKRHDHALTSCLLSTNSLSPQRDPQKPALFFFRCR